MNARWLTHARDGRPRWWYYFEPPRWFPRWLRLATCTHCRGIRAHFRDRGRGMCVVDGCLWPLTAASLQPVTCARCHAQAAAHATVTLPSGQHRHRDVRDCFRAILERRLTP